MNYDHYHIASLQLQPGDPNHEVQIDEEHQFNAKFYGDFAQLQNFLTNAVTELQNLLGPTDENWDLSLQVETVEQDRGGTSWIYINPHLPGNVYRYNGEQLIKLFYSGLFKIFGFNSETQEYESVANLSYWVAEEYMDFVSDQDLVEVFELGNLILTQDGTVAVQ